MFQYHIIMVDGDEFEMQVWADTLEQAEIQLRRSMARRYPDQGYDAKITGT